MLEYYSALRKEGNDAIWDKDEPRRCHAKWNKSDTEG